MNNLQKTNPWRNSRYLSWIRKQACCWTGRTGNIQAHHIIDVNMGTGSMGSKVSDLWAIPLDAEAHCKLHQGMSGFQLDQKAEALKMIEKAVSSGILIMGKSEPFDEWADGLED